MAATDQRHFIIFVDAKKIKVRKYLNFTHSHSPRYGDGPVFFKVELKLKLAATDKLHFF